MPALKKLDINASFFPRAFPQENDEEMVENTGAPTTKPQQARQPSFGDSHAASSSGPTTRVNSESGVDQAAGVSPPFILWLLPAASRRWTSRNADGGDRRHPSAPAELSPR